MSASRFSDQIIPSRAAFDALATRGNLVPVRLELLADLETPVSALVKLRRANPGAPAFLLESVEGGENLARYSFLGVGARGELKVKNRHAKLTFDGNTREWELENGEDPLSVIEREMARFQFVDAANLPRFCGGAVGFLGWEFVRFLEKLPDAPPDDRGIPDAQLLFCDTVLVFDAVRHTITIFNCAHVENGDAAAAYTRAVSAIEATVEALSNEIVPSRPFPVQEIEEGQPKSNFPSRADFEGAVQKCIDFIHQGDCVQIVPSQRFEVELSADPLSVYRALRHVSPAPYMVFLDLGDVQLLAASPEILVTEDKGNVLTRPLAGTRRRGATPEEDIALEVELLADPKEVAEHVMLVDLARNDLGRVCEYGSVEVTDLMYVQRFSHVMHITSDVKGKLRKDKTAYDVLRAAFPAGTLSGAPKVRAMQIIDSVEPTRRGPYGGAMGYFGWNGDMDTCITLRTIVVKDGKAYVQAGGGVVADSKPADEYEETRNKARAALRAIALAQREAGGTG
ncbi:anthranilate synthase component 1 [Abditibacteriota bacterium]|nr:anthranilate synthase component 1 [Abditibacteriota bacterium]